MTVVDPMQELHRAVYAHVSATLTTPVLDFVPEDTPYPYVTIGETQMTRTDTHSTYSTEMYMTLHVWTRSEGWSQARGIAGQIRAILDNQQNSITLESPHRLALIRMDRTGSMRDPDPGVRHMPIRYRVLVESNPVE